MHPEHWAGLSRLLIRSLKSAKDGGKYENPAADQLSKAQTVIERCWGNDPDDIEYGDFVAKVDFNVYVLPAAQAAGLAIVPLKWEDSVKPALSMLRADTHFCGKCSELGLKRVVRAWEYVPEGQCPFCVTGVMVRVAGHETSINWITGGVLERGRDFVNENGINIPLTHEGVLDFLRTQLGRGVHQFFAGVNPLQALNWLLLGGRTTRIRTAQDALSALADPTAWGMLATHASLMRDTLARGEFFTQAVKMPPVGGAVTLTGASGGPLKKPSFFEVFPYPWHNGSAQEFMSLLLQAYPSNEAITSLGERVGVKRYSYDSSGASMYTIRNLIEQASRGGKLMALAEAVLSDHMVAGFHGPIRAVLAKG